MKIKKIEISKFRSIENGSFVIDDIVGIVGQNNSGKTAILRALNSFFNPEMELMNFINGRNLYSTNRAIPRITITFNDVPIKPEYTPHTIDGEIIIQQEFKKVRNKLEYRVLSNGNYSNASEALINELFADVQFILIPTERSSLLNGNSENSILNQLLKSYFLKYTAKRDTLTPKIRTAFNYLQKNALKKVVSGIEGQYLANKGFEIKIDSTKPITYELFLNELRIKIIEDNKEFDLQECGSGVQSLVAIAIHRYLAELTQSNFIIGIEEPETNLHPQGQKELIYTLLDEVRNNGIQILFTSHSTVLIDQIEHNKIVLIRKVDDRQRHFKSKILQIDDNFWVNHNLTKIQYDKFHRFKNSEFFFAEHVIVSESPIDSEVFRILLKTKGIQIERKGISILELSGIDSLKYAYFLLKELEIPKTIVLDKDFFFDYQNGEKENSRYGSGFFNYSNTYKNNPLIAEIINNQQDRQDLEDLLTSNHSRALDITVRYDVISMKYNLEMDLVSSRTAQDLIYNRLNIPQAQQNTNEILTNRKKAIKKIELLSYIINNLQQRNLPNSYKRLIRRIKAI